MPREQSELLRIRDTGLHVMPVFLQCISEEFRQMLKELSMTPVTLHFLRLTPECEGSRDLMLKGGKMPSKMNMTDDEDDAPKTKKKRKPSAYNIFVGDCQRGRPEGTKVTEHMKVCSVRWKALPDSEKEQYKERAKEA